MRHRVISILILATAFLSTISVTIGISAAQMQWQYQFSVPPATTPKKEEPPPEFLYFDDNWMLMRSSENKERIIKLAPDFTRVAILFNGNTASKVLESFKQIAGREFVRLVPHSFNYVAEQWEIFKLIRRYQPTDYFALLEMIRRDPRVTAVSPVVSYNGAPSIVLPRVRLRFKPLHDPGSNNLMSSFILIRAPAFSYTGNYFSIKKSKTKEEQFYILEPGQKLAEPFLKAVDKLASEDSVLWAIPEIIELDIPITANATLINCATGKPFPGIPTIETSDVICYLLRIVYDPKRVNIISDLSKLTNPDDLRDLHQSDPNKFPLSFIKKAKLSEDQVSGRNRITIRYEIAFYDTGDFQLVLPSIKYEEKTFAKKNPLELRPNVSFVKITGLIHSQMSDFIPMPPPEREASSRQAPPLVKPIVTNVSAPERPFLVSSAEKTISFADRTARWAWAHKARSAWYGAGAILIGIGAIFAFLLSPLVPYIVSAIQTLSARTARLIKTEFAFRRATRELSRLTRSSAAVRSDFELAIRKLVKRSSGGKFTKGMSNFELLHIVSLAESSEVGKSEEEPSLVKLLTLLFDYETNEREFKAAVSELIRLLPLKRYLFRKLTND